MGLFRTTGKFVYRTFLDVPAWLGWRNIKKDTQSLYNTIQSIFAIRKADKETFEQAKERLNLTDQDIAASASYYIKLTIVFVAVGFLCIAYTFYLFVEGTFIAGIIALLVAFFVFLKAFSVHFQYFQIKNRKLGCTFQEWFNGKIEATTK